MRLFEPLWIAISTYSVLPAPRAEWDGRNTRYALCFLPAVGLIPGGALLLWRWACMVLRADAVLFAAVAAVLPLVLTGGIHMDGFMDTVDALSSHQPRERRLEIMKDPHCGAFAVLFCGAYLLTCFGLYEALYRSPAAPVICVGFVLSRALGVLSAATLPNARGDGMLFALTAQLQKRAVIVSMCALCLLCAGGMLWISLPCGAAGCLFALICFFLYRRMASRQFGGATGDTTGYLIQLCELCVLAGVWLGGLL